MRQNDDYAKLMEAARLLPGMVAMLEVMQAHVDITRDALRNAGAPVKPQRRPAIAASTNGSRGWPADPEARKIEARRRRAVAKKRQKV
jgi:hypothetical protein